MKGCKELPVSSLSNIIEGFPKVRIVSETLILDTKQCSAVVKRVFKMRQRTSGGSGSILYYLLFGGCFLAPFPLKRASTFTITARNIPQ